MAGASLPAVDELVDVADKSVVPPEVLVVLPEELVVEAEELEILDPSASWARTDCTWQASQAAITQRTDGALNFLI